MSANFDRAYFFGDSLSDTGNALRLSFGQVPFAPYAPGRFSNGDVWVDSLAEELDLDVDPVTRNIFSNDDLNFAVGGATSGRSNYSGSLPGLKQQIDTFELLARFQSPQELNDDLFFLWVGSNDYFSFIEDDESTPDVIETDFPETRRERKDAVIEVVDINIGGAIQEMIDAGGKDIVVFNLPDLDRTPLAQDLTSQDRRDLRKLTNIHNRRLSRLARNTETANPDVNIIEVDVNELFDDIRDDPNRFGFTNITDNYTGIDLYAEIENPPSQGNPNEFLFWDSVHPTTTAQSLVTDLVMDELNDEGLILD
ncbi:Phospholipase/lecithinase/hemolysin (fragment) [Hyella patelloides LEGE 07179]|uniref:Phospholipase/lecithinase/hemolysin n=1 Tax=Hyella patelloides LEGE 07179 TaxID=945734 RepID=A0A563VYE2_9CYAN